MTLSNAVGRCARDTRCIIMVMLAVAGTMMIGCGRRAPAEQAAEASEAEEQRATPVQVATAMRGNIDEVLEITGTAEAADEVDVVAEASGKVARVHADVGDRVRRGQTLVQVDREVAAAQRDQAAAGVAGARSRLEEAREALELTESTTASNVRQAEVGIATAQERLEQARASARVVESEVANAIQQAQTGVQTAETRLAEVEAGARDQERRQAEAAVRQARSSLDLAQDTYNRQSSLLEAGVIAQQQYDQVRNQLELARENYEQAREQLSLVEEGPRTEQVRLAQLAVDQARQQLAQAQAQRTQIEVAQQEVRAAEQAVRQAEEQRASALAGRKQVDVQRRQVASAEQAIGQAQAGERVASVQLGKHVVRSPVSGLVASRMVETGEGAMAGGPVMRIVRINPIRVHAVVSERDIGRISEGDVGVVTFDGIGEREFRGTVTDISPQALPDSRNFVARVEVDNPEGVIRPGMFARISLLLDTRQDVVVIQRDALVERERVNRVHVVVDNAIEVREVEVGVIRRNIVEIIDGVREGETVVVAGQEELAEGQRVTPVDRASNAAE